jgi:hypothetical protein
MPGGVQSSPSIVGTTFHQPESHSSEQTARPFASGPRQNRHRTSGCGGLGGVRLLCRYRARSRRSAMVRVSLSSRKIRVPRNDIPAIRMINPDALSLAQDRIADSKPAHPGRLRSISVGAVGSAKTNSSRPAWTGDGRDVQSVCPSWVTTSLSRPVRGRSALRPTAVEARPNVQSERDSGRAQATL